MQTNINTLRQNNEDLEAEVKRMEEDIVQVIKTDIDERSVEEAQTQSINISLHF
jgi:cell division protein FtsB